MLELTDVGKWFLNRSSARLISFALQLKAGHLNDLAGPWATRRATSATRAIRGAVWGAWRARRRPVDSGDR